VNVFDLPFDQYQRYRAVSDLLASADAGPPGLVLEVGGGFESRLSAFLPEAEVVIADLEVAPGTTFVRPVRADGCRLPFRDRTFPAAITIDTLEHLPAETRPALLRELRRVTTGPVITACPVSSVESVAAELALGACYRALFATDHRWLAEHLARGLPTAAEIEAVLAGFGGAWRSQWNGYLPEWEPLMFLHLVFDEMPGGAADIAAVRALDALYNERLYPFSNRPPAYRMVWIHVPRATELPPVRAEEASAPPAEARLAFDAALRAAAEAVKGGRHRERVNADRSRVERLRVETIAERDRLRAEVHRLRAEQERLEIDRRAWISECEYLQRRCSVLTEERAEVDAERDALRAQVGELRWRLGRLWPLDRVADVVAPVVRPLLASVRRRQRRGSNPYGTNVQARLTSSQAAVTKSTPTLTILVSVRDGTREEALQRTRQSIREQSAPPLEAREVRPVPSGLADIKGSHVAFVLPGDRLAPNACAEITRALDEHPDATLVYTDEDEWPPRGQRQNPQLKPAWDPELARAAGYPGSLACYRRDLLARVPSGLSVAEIGYALTLAATEHEERLVIHVPLVLYHGDPANRGRRRIDPGAAAPQALLAAHLEQCGENGRVIPAGPGFRIARPVDPHTCATIVIPYCDGPDLTARCVQSLLSHTRHPSWEIVFVDNRSTDPRAEEVVTGLIRTYPDCVRRLRYPLPYNFSAMNNLAARQARGDVLVLLNNDTEILTDDWLEQLVSLANRPAVGAVGVLLFYPDGRIQHCGVVLGMGSWPGRAHGVAGLLFRGCRPEEADPLLYAYDRRAGAVTAACVAIRRDRYLEAGGLDEALRNDFNDVDLCLKLAARGWHTLYTPHVQATHHESATRSYRALDTREVELMFERWGDRLAADTHVSPHFDRTTLRPPLAMRSSAGSHDARRLVGDSASR